jgi:hypothetical protein
MAFLCQLVFQHIGWRTLSAVTVFQARRVSTSLGPVVPLLVGYYVLIDQLS